MKALPIGTPVRTLASYDDWLFNKYANRDAFISKTNGGEYELLFVDQSIAWYERRQFRVRDGLDSDAKTFVEWLRRLK